MYRTLSIFSKVPPPLITTFLFIQYSSFNSCLQVASRGYENLPKDIHIIKVDSSLDMYENLVNFL